MIKPQPLPIDPLLPSICQTLDQHDELVLEAPPGAGKTTRVPLALLGQPWLDQKKILLLEPRRLAAKAAAQRLAEQLEEKVGQTVGYRIRMETRVSAATRIEVVTEGILTRMLQDDPGLEDVGLVIFDEFHERSLDADTGLALILQGRELLREGPPLKLLLMSATLDGAAVSDLLGGAPVLRSEGRAYPVELVYSPPSRIDTPVEERVVNRIRQALDRHDGSLLVFLPGQREIRRVRQLLDDSLPNHELLITPLYGDLSLGEQQQAITAAPPGKRKIVLATAIAETSLTIEGIEVVIDAGLSRQARFDPGSGMTRLLTTRVSAAAATQRAGRAGRLGPGTCYRLWSEQQQAQLEPQTPAEIQHADLAPLALQLLKWGVNDPTELCWLTPPPAAAYNQSLELLRQLDAVETLSPGQFRLTARGEQMAQLPAHPRLSHMLLCGAEQGQARLAADLAALLSERDPLNTPQSDLTQRLEWLQSSRGKGQGQRLQRLAQQYFQLSDNLSTAEQTPHRLTKDSATGYLIACAYPDRIARRRDNQTGQYRLSLGRGAKLSEQDRLNRCEWLAVAALTSRQDSATDLIRLACPLDPELFEHLLADMKESEEVVIWNAQQDRLIAERQTRIGQLVLHRDTSLGLPPDRITAALIAHIRRQGLRLLPWDEAAEELRQRLAFVRQHDPAPSRWPDLSDTALLNTLEKWLSPWLEGINKGSDFARLDMADILRSQLEWSQQQELDRLAPERIQVPSGSRIRVNYSQSPPVLAVKLQEMFGCTDTPRLGFNIPVILHLLSPAQRPLQVTQDLAGFWQGSYAEVRKEMKGRYPKHPWPEDPTSAPATSRTKRTSQS
ncbi:ATP-dependent helicase HrpB [Marinobacterium sediminicola]|uniref:ATP-dependent helicase HrpB n=1 Tax=Marinobacterium sediminicola TaxID=518898 RepID=A0ABY1RZQ7_9GAMM|nr:ATP-dependent helicase HrpB [Marinobacterium sediminicola]ULG69982.1 ATP-dependent helicase HrpB [Marinobacterium sediminicola]SMR74434.1 ATP-dependent helicase HrpB [Marinobacterium sediminicola]